MAEATGRSPRRKPVRPGTGRPGRASRAGPPPAPSTPPAPAPPICSVAFCPICTAVTALGEIRPELMEHLLLAGREVLLAFRSVIDARLEGMEPAGKLERLTIE